MPDTLMRFAVFHRNLNLGRPGSCQASPRGSRKLGGGPENVCRKFGASPGSPNAWLEHTLGVSATTRAWTTIVRITRLEA